MAKLVLAAFVAAFFVTAPGLASADEPCVGPIKTVQWMAWRYPGSFVRTVLHDTAAVTFVAALNAEPPVSNDTADGVIAFERRPVEGAMVFLLLRGCLQADYSLPRKWVEQHLSPAT